MFWKTACCLLLLTVSQCVHALTPGDEFFLSISNFARAYKFLGQNPGTETIQGVVNANAIVDSAWKAYQPELRKTDPEKADQFNERVQLMLFISKAVITDTEEWPDNALYSEEELREDYARISSEYMEHVEKLLQHQFPDANLEWKGPWPYSDKNPVMLANAVSIPMLEIVELHTGMQMPEGPHRPNPEK